MKKWIEVATQEDWVTVLEHSKTQPVLLLKHSTTCPISAGAWDECQAIAEDHSNETILFAYVKVIESRSVSNKIAEDLKIKHESPQLILLKQKKANWNTSHWSITYDTVEKILSNL